MAAKEPVVLLKFTSGNQLTSHNYAAYADRCMKSYMDGYKDARGEKKLTTTKLRGVYSLIMNVYSRVNDAEDFEAAKPDLQYLKVKMAYESGRDESVKAFLGKTALMVALDGVKTYEQFLVYCRYAESLVAYFKFHGGKE